MRAPASTQDQDYLTLLAQYPKNTILTRRIVCYIADPFYKRVAELIIGVRTEGTLEEQVAVKELLDWADSLKLTRVSQ